MAAASELRRAAKSLVERAPLSIVSHYSAQDSAARLTALIREGRLEPSLVAEATADGVSMRRASGETVLAAAWKPDESGARLEGEFFPSVGTQRLLKLVSAFLGVLVLMAGWVLVQDGPAPLKVATGLFAALSILAFPLFVAGLASQRAAREATIARAMRRALTRE